MVIISLGLVNVQKNPSIQPLVGPGPFASCVFYFIIVNEVFESLTQLILIHG